MDQSHVVDLILNYRYWILIPLTFIEGPIVALIAGTLASAGLFNVYILAIVFFVRDVGLDGVYYALGYYGGRTAFAKRMLARIGVTEAHLADVGRLWEKHPGKTLFIGKLSYGIASAFIVVAGMVKMPLTTFFKYGSLVAILQYGTLLFVGYFFGQAFGGSLDRIIKNIEYVALAAGVLITIYYFFGHKMKALFLAEDRKAQL
jgi:membrane protein DedA with SNARE-associated domain